MIIEKIFEKAHKMCKSALRSKASKTKILSKKLLATIVSVVVLLAGVPLTAWAETTFNVTANGIQWTCTVLQENDTDTTNVAIAPKDTDSISSAVTIPSEVQYNSTPYTVTTIGEWAFKDCSNLTSVVIPNGVTVIGDWAFEHCDNLTSVTIPDSVTTIGKSAFSSCYNLTSVTIPDGVTTIGESAFYECYNLTSVNIPDSVTVIGKYAFKECENLESLTIPNSVKEIGSQAFQNCYALKRVNSEKDGECIIPEGVEEIGFGAFTHNNQLETVKIPSSVTAIGVYAFAYNENLTSITVESNNPNYKDIDGVLFTKDGKTLVQYPAGKSQTAYEIPDGVTTIGSSTFNGCSNLESITIPDGVTTIDDGAFSYCSNLESITIPNSVTTIGDFAFNSCSNLESITILGSIERVKFTSEYGYTSYAFDDCDNVTSVIIGNADITLPEDLFVKFPNLNSITIPCNFDKSKFEETGINVEGDNFAVASGSYSSDSDVGESQEMPGTFTYIHDFEIDSVAKEVTDTTPGALKYVCSVCKAAEKEEEVPALSERKAKELAQTVDMNGQEVNAILQDPYKVLPDGAYMTATLVKPGTDRYNELVSQLDNTHIPENMAFFEIELYHADGTKFDESEMPLARKVRVLLQIPEGWDKEDMEAVLIASGADVEFEENIVTLDGVDYVAFWTDHFSPYAMIDKLTDEEAAELAAHVKTGESIGNYMIFGEVLILASAMLWIAIKKKKDLE